jgi:hypothetical protein
VLPILNVKPVRLPGVSSSVWEQQVGRHRAVKDVEACKILSTLYDYRLNHRIEVFVSNSFVDHFRERAVIVDDPLPYGRAGAGAGAGGARPASDLAPRDTSCCAPRNRRPRTSLLEESMSSGFPGAPGDAAGDDPASGDTMMVVDMSPVSPLNRRLSEQVSTRQNGLHARAGLQDLLFDEQHDVLPADVGLVPELLNVIKQWPDTELATSAFALLLRHNYQAGELEQSLSKVMLMENSAEVLQAELIYRRAEDLHHLLLVELLASEKAHVDTGALAFKAGKVAACLGFLIEQLDMDAESQESPLEAAAARVRSLSAARLPERLTELDGNGARGPPNVRPATPAAPACTGPRRPCPSASSRRWSPSRAA